MDDYNCDKKAKKYAQSIRKSIKADYGFVPQEWEAQLIQLQDMYEQYLYCSMKLREIGDPVSSTNGGKTICVSSYFNVMVQATKTMDNILKQFGLNPISKKKLRGLNGDDGDDAFTDL